MAMPVIAGWRGTITGMWEQVADRIRERRAELRLTRAQLADAARVSARLLGDLENARRANYDGRTLAQVELALGWRRGAFARIGHGQEPELANPHVEPEPSWLSTPEGIARHLHRDDLVLTALLHRAGLTEPDLFRLILHVRAVRERQNAELLADVASRIRAAGGWAPEQPYPPTWLGEDGGRPG